MTSTTDLGITEVAERTGFSGPTLRYYEEIELLPAPHRTASGLPDLRRARRRSTRLHRTGEAAGLFA